MQSGKRTPLFQELRHLHKQIRHKESREPPPINNPPPPLLGPRSRSWINGSELPEPTGPGDSGSTDQKMKAADGYGRSSLLLLTSCLLPLTQSSWLQPEAQLFVKAAAGVRTSLIFQRNCVAAPRMADVRCRLLLQRKFIKCLLFQWSRLSYFSFINLQPLLGFMKKHIWLIFVR